MTRRMRQIFLTIITLLFAELLALVLLVPARLEDPKPPDSIEGKAAWLAEHPADWLTASALTDAALDTPDAHRFELWRAAYAHAKRLAPFRGNPNAAFVRAGFFHWYELPPADRAAVLNAAGPLMRDPPFFSRMYPSILQLTHDFAWVLAHAPDTDAARGTLRNLAVERGLFAEYRVLREDLRKRRMQSFNAQRATTDPSALVELLPDRMDTADEPLVRGILEELERKAFDPERMPGRIEQLVDYAVDHEVQPLHGLLPMLETQSKLRDVTRARAALQLDNPALATRIEITTSIKGAPEWEPYYLDRARFEARHGDAPSANAHLVYASMHGASLKTLAAGEDVAHLLGDAPLAAAYHAQVMQLAQQPTTWNNTCGPNELCATVSAVLYVPGKELALTLANAQSDEVVPYVEVYVDEALSAEGEVTDARTFTLAVEPGLHRIEVRLVNPHTRNGIQRRVRLS